MDAKQFLYVPRWVRVISFILLGFMVVVGVGIALYGLGSGLSSELIQTALTIAQVAGSGLIVALVAFYSFRQAQAPRLRRLTEDWLTKDLCAALADMGTATPAGGLGGADALKLPGFVEATVECEKAMYNLVFYRIKAKDTTITMCVRLKVREVLVFYFLPVGSMSLADIEAKLSRCFNVSKTIGYNMTLNQIEFADFDQRAYYQYTLHQKLKDDFLVDSLEKLYLAQDISSMTHSFMLECTRQNVHTHYQNEFGVATAWKTT